MKPLTIVFSALALCIALAIAIAVPAQAQSALKRPIRAIVASSPGGPSDVQMRLLAPKMSESLGQTIVVDNRPSSNGVVGADLCAHAAPDGLTICVGNSGTHAINATLYRKLQYDVIRDFQPISLMGTTGMVVAINPKIPATTLKELIAHAQKQPGKTTVGIAGATGQFAGDALWQRLGMKMNNINFKGSAPTELSLLSGEINCALLTPLASMQHVKSGRMRAMGITSVKRNALIPDLLTVAELGVTGYAFEFWNGIFAPAGTPQPVVMALHKAMVHALDTPEVRERLMKLGFTPGGEAPAAYTKFVHAEVEKFRKQILDSGVPQL